MAAPDWVRHAIWWQVYPLGATGAEPEALPPGAEPVPRLRALQNWLDHLLQLGCNGLALGPVFASQTHGYDTVDHFAVDPRLGTEQDLVDLAAACSARGIRVLLDGVFNHVGRGFPRGLHQQLIGLRRRSPWLVDATLEAPDVLTNEVLAVRLTSGTRTLALVLDVGDAAAEVVLPFPGGTVDAGSGSAHTDGSRTTVRVPPHSFAVVGRSG